MAPRRSRWRATVALATALAPLVLARSAAAGARVFFGGWVGPPVIGLPYPYPYPYPFPYYPSVYAGYPQVAPPSPPPGWVAGHWEVRQDPSGQSLRVWVPSYLR
jgi:hypothetical protein